METIKSVASRLSDGQYKKYCPECHHSRQKTHDKSLSLKIDSDGVQFFCHHCNASGGWMHEKLKLDFVKPLLPITIPNGSNPEVIAYLKSRHISDNVIQKYTVQGVYTFNGKPMPAVGFPYRDGNKVVAVKWRSANGSKYFSQENICQDFFNLGNYVRGNDILIVEGEMDVLSWLSVDVPGNCTVVSIPNGAPAMVKDGKVDPKEDRKFAYIWRAKKQLDTAKKIFLCCDNDTPGMALRDEIVRRVGSNKIWLVDLENYKDTSEALDQKGESFLLDALDEALPLPTVGLHSAGDFTDEYIQLYEEGQILGASTGILSLDRFIQIVPGQMTVVTGFPSSGKSDLVDQICVNLAHNEGWKTVYCSFEKPPSLHLAQLAQKVVDMPFFEGPSTRMSRIERDYALEWCKDNFLFMDHSLDGPCDIDGILDVAAKAVWRMGVRVLVIDPYNFIELAQHERETDAITKMLTKVQRWVSAHDAHCFFIAHPTKVSPDRFSDKKVVVTGHDIAGSASWFAKADIGFTVWRHPRDEELPECHVWKVRWSFVGHNGSCQLDFNRATGKWSDVKSEVQDLTRWDWDGFDENLNHPSPPLAF
jgi:twinkle protein